MTKAQERALRAKEAIEKICIENNINMTIYDGEIGFVDPVENKIVLIWHAEYKAAGSQGGQNVTQKEFEQRIRKGKTFKQEEKAGIHIIELDEGKPPVIQITGELNTICGMLGFAMSKMIEEAANDTGDRTGIEKLFRKITESAIALSRI